MRPRHIAAENLDGLGDQPQIGLGFNEAAAYSRGKHVSAMVMAAMGDVASMRPRHIAAENVTCASSPSVLMILLQ